ncbi:MAG: ferredoxin-type protein NapG [Gammaproteobacteria bacterium]|nr:ferredoxin-type protein NapG [Gammaproteobacteria bacterium]
MIDGAHGHDRQRRRFLAETTRAATAAGLFCLGLGVYARRSAALPAQALRPPGAGAEADFLGACVRCGLCVRACPYGTLDLARLGEDVATGTPYFVARRVPCEMCDDIPCVRACPTGALDRSLTDIGSARMGLAVLVDQESCLNFLGLRCDVCYRVCPAVDQAITLEQQHNQRTGRHTRFIPVVYSDHCTGCGKCEQSCVLDESAIKVLPLALARGAAGPHYRFGGGEQDEAGARLVAPAAGRPSG